MILATAQPTSLTFFGDLKWQIMWRENWRRFTSWYHFHPRDEDGPAELYFGFWIFQFHKCLYEK